ncbi:hypothetical protein DFP95_101339 [Cohnella lupini]|uniref:Uncharacterized protein n=2 Tax=Cohnella lupini TaxID=1294267 RepID=A0A3D9IVY6_9BACL|nr:hypothetical protein DFP95_101339 [Cohnella lupini]
MLVSQHMAYAIKHPDELQQYESVYEHMLHYFMKVIGMAEDLAVAHLEDFFSEMPVEEDVDSRTAETVK